jgi:crotonobetainyl-CoA:carnitine CoA-transferase CaiB-like acyl-CoA transferase
MAAIFEGLKVIDLSQVAAVPMTTRILADFGADVVHVENLETGDIFRHTLAGSQTSSQAEINYVWEHYNRNKRSMTLDITKKTGQKILHRLLGAADIFATNLRPYQLVKFNLEYETLQKLNPRLIAAYLSGTGKEGDEKDYPAYDHTAYWARSGIPHKLRAMSPALREPGAILPAFIPAFGDHVTGLALCTGILLALYDRERTGLGREVTGSLFQSGIYQMSWDVAAALTTGEDCVTVDPDKDILNPLYAQYLTKDDRWLLFTALNPLRYLSQIMRAVDREDLIGDPRFATIESFVENQALLKDIMTETFKTKDLEEWVEILNKEQVPYSPVRNFVEIANDPQARVNGFFESYEHPEHGRIEGVANPINVGENEKSVRMPAPEFGQHTEEILLEHGYDWDDIIQFQEEGVIAGG